MNRVAADVSPLHLNSQEVSADSCRLPQRTQLALITALLLAAFGLTPVNAATTRHVWPDSPSPAPPYDTWATAAHAIQEAVNAAADGDTVLVTNGVYSSITVTQSLTLQSVNGAEVTSINAQRAGRCATLGTQAALSGFTLTNGWAGDGGGAHGGMLSNCVLIGNSAYDRGGGAGRSTLHNCTLTGNSADGLGGGGANASTLYNCILIGNSAAGTSGFGILGLGGGARDSTLYNCTLTGNSARSGGGVAGRDLRSKLYNCTLTDNSAADSGGGAYADQADRSTLTGCILTGNTAGKSGGGTYHGALTNCTLTGNSAGESGGGVNRSTLYGCILTGNSVTGTNGSGGGAYEAYLYNCTLTGNSATGLNGAGGGTSRCGPSRGRLANCIVYFNTAKADANYSGGSISNSCTAPLPPGPGNIDVNPQLVSATHLSLNSPCIGAGWPIYNPAPDIDGEPWANPPCIGADQVVPGNATGPLSVSIRATHLRFAVGFAASFVAEITGHASANSWDFGDGTVVTNDAYPSHAWLTPGSYEVRLTAYNDSHPEGVSTTLTVEVVDEVYYVNVANATPQFPYTNWATAATRIQDAIDAGSIPGRLVLVTNGVYAAGGVAVVGTMTNRVALAEGMRVQSMNGPAVTVIVGYGPGGTIGDGAIRCAYIGANAVLSGFTLTNGHTRNYENVIHEGSGGGAWCESSGVVTNCILTGNAASGYGGGVRSGTIYNCTLSGNSADRGGGAYDSTLHTCTLTSNVARENGGGAGGGTLYHCTLTGNSALGANGSGGGAYISTLYDCSLTGNSAGWAGGGAYQSTLYNCTMAGNSADDDGGGAYNSTLHNCALTGNSANSGGGAFWGTLYNCTLTNNTGGGASGSALNYCTLTGNSANSGGGASGGSRLTNCVLTGNSALSLGGGADNSTLHNCILSNNSARDGGGATVSTLNKCMLHGNTATNQGGGTHNAWLRNCTLTGNSAALGGGAYRGTLYNCTVIGNTAASSGGGVRGEAETAGSVCQLFNCIVYYNAAPTGPDYGPYCSFSDSCTTPLPPGLGNVANAPLFVDQAAGDFRLLPGSPCIDAGTNLSAFLTTDLAGLPRPLDGDGDGVAAFDMGAYEFLLPTADSNGDGIPDGWTQQHGLNPCDPSVAAGNPDQDAHTTFEEWQGDTDPTDAHSCFHIKAIAQGPPVTVQFQSSSNRVYTLLCASNVADAVWTEVPGQIAVPGSGGLHTLSDTNPAPATFYRLGVRVP